MLLIFQPFPYAVQKNSGNSYLRLAFADELVYSKAMSNPSELSAAFILQLKHELDSDIRLFKELPDRIAQRKKRFEAALMFAPLGFDPNVAPAPIADDKEEAAEVTCATNVEEHEVDAIMPEFKLTAVEVSSRGDAPSWAKAIRSVLEASDSGLTHKELLAKIRTEFPTMPMSVGDKGFYNGISKLSEQKLLIKHGGLLYSAQTVAAINARGESLPDSPSSQVRAGSSGEIILTILNEHKAGLTAADLKILVSNVADAPASLSKHSQFIYNVLATLIGSGQVEKIGSLYRLAEKNKAPVGTGALL